MRNSLFLGYWVLCSSLCSAQSGFNKRHDPLQQLEADFGWSIEPCDSGGYLVVSNCPWTDSLEYGSVVVVSRIDEQGALIAEHRFIDIGYWNYPGWSNSSGALNDGGLVIGGNRVGAQEDSRASLFLFDSVGLPGQHYHFGEAGETWVGRQAKQAPDGGFVLAGSRSQDADNQGFLLKTDANGAQVWVQAFGGPSLDLFYAVDAVGEDYYLGGQFSVTVSNRDHWIVRVGPLGEQRWQRIWGGPYNDPAAHLQTCADGHVLMASGRKYNNNSGVNHLYMAKLDSADGSTLWENTYGIPTVNTTLFAVKEVEPIGDLIATGQALDDNGEVGVLLRTTSAGDSLWMRYYTYYDVVIDTGDAQLRDVLPTPDGGFIAVGVAFGTGPYSQDVWVIKTDSMGCIEPGCNLIMGMETQITNLRDVLRVSPNPVPSASSVQVQLDLPATFGPQGALRLTVVSSDGRVVREEQLTSPSSPFTLQAPTSAGLYHIHLSDATRWISGAKLVVE